MDSFCIMEIWKKIKNYPQYEISNIGNVKSLGNEFTRKENINHAFKNNLKAKGQNRTQSKLTDKEVLEIRDSNLRNIELSRLYNISKSIISGIQKGRLWKHVN